MKSKIYHNERSCKTFLCLGFRSYSALGIRMVQHHVNGKEPLVSYSYSIPIPIRRVWIHLKVRDILIDDLIKEIVVRDGPYIFETYQSPVHWGMKKRIQNSS